MACSAPGAWRPSPVHVHPGHVTSRNRRATPGYAETPTSETDTSTDDRPKQTDKHRRAETSRRLQATPVRSTRQPLRAFAHAVTTGKAQKSNSQHQALQPGASTGGAYKHSRKPTAQSGVSIGHRPPRNRPASRPPPSASSGVKSGRALRAPMGGFAPANSLQPIRLRLTSGRGFSSAPAPSSLALTRCTHLGGGFNVKSGWALRAPGTCSPVVTRRHASGKQRQGEGRTRHLTRLSVRSRCRQRQSASDNQAAPHGSGSDIGAAWQSAGDTAGQGQGETPQVLQVPLGATRTRISPESLRVRHA